MKKCCTKNKIENLLDVTKINELLNRKQPEPVVEKKKHTVLWIIIIVASVLAIAGIAFALYKYFKPEYVDDFDDDFDDDLDDDLDDDEEEDDDDSDKE